MSINREVSQFANFINVNDTSKTIGINTSVGIGTTIPTAKLKYPCQELVI